MKDEVLGPTLELSQFHSVEKCLLCVCYIHVFMILGYGGHSDDRL